MYDFINFKGRIEIEGTDKARCEAVNILLANGFVLAKVENLKFTMIKPDVDNISGPPCKECEFWKPSVNPPREGYFDGITLCTKENMEHDFSCFSPRKV